MRNVNEKWIWLDMDGTFADLYGVNGWLENLLAHDVRPYRDCKPLYNMVDLLEVLTELKLVGYNIGIISWLSKDNDFEYGKQVAYTKKNWLRDYCMDLVLDKILITPYGVRKADTCRKYGLGILVDDEEQNRNAWDLGTTINANENIIEKLWELVK